MKFILVLTIALATVSSIAVAWRGPGGHHGRGGGGIFSRIAKIIKDDATAKTALTTALTEAGFSQYFNETSINFRALDQHLMTVIQASEVQTFITTYVAPKWSDVSTKVSSVLTAIQNLETNATLVNQLAGRLISKGFSSYVSGSVGSFTLDYVAIQNDARAARFLNQYLLKGTKKGGKKGGKKDGKKDGKKENDKENNNGDGNGDGNN